MHIKGSSKLATGFNIEIRSPIVSTEKSAPLFLFYVLLPYALPIKV